MTNDRQQNIILVVDDSPDSLGMINTALDAAGYTVLVALNGKQALAIAEQIRPSVILLDALMPVMNGFECCPELRKLLPLTPIIFMTGLTEIENIVNAFNAGVNDYISKPIHPEELLVRIKRHCQNANDTNNARDALDVARQYVLAVNTEGKLLWATPEAEQIIKTAGGWTDVDAQLQRWIKQTNKNREIDVQVNEDVLTLRYVKKTDNNEHLFRIVQQEVIFNAEALETMLSITRREAEVLLWIAYGKSNKEIARLLSMSPRTVNKHLENLYPKINVDNRAAATSIAIKSLLGF